MFVLHCKRHLSGWNLSRFPIQYHESGASNAFSTESHVEQVKLWSIYRGYAEIYAILFVIDHSCLGLECQIDWKIPFTFWYLSQIKHIPFYEIWRKYGKFQPQMTLCTDMYLVVMLTFLLVLAKTTISIH